MGLTECGEAPWAKGEDGVLAERAVGFGPSPLASLHLNATRVVGQGWVKTRAGSWTMVLAMVLASKLSLVTVASGVARLEVGGQSTLDC
ncbi:hypothetical protein FJTKL_14876 [Diaporthe vaccinii]|uniref:Uncharacterized protein n=1 Tax=Diaporthe vaccinii TaxID=105482 RepID=A0ABR4F8F7_9PEZI